MNELDDIFDKLNESLTPSLEQLRELQKQLGLEIQRSIIADMMNARTMEELSEIKRSNEVWFVEFSKLSLHYENAAKRLQFVNLIRKHNWPVSELN